MFITPEYKEKNILIATSLNISNNEIEDKNIFFKNIGISTDNLVYMNQTHSSNVVKIESSNAHLYSYKNEKLVIDTDAITTNLKNTPLLVRTADCLPVVFIFKREASYSGNSCWLAWYSIRNNFTDHRVYGRLLLNRAYQYLCVPRT